MFKTPTFILFSLLFSISLNGQEMEDSTANKRLQFLLDRYEAKTADSLELAALRSIGYQIQSKGFNLEQTLHDYAGALPHIDKALMLWKKTADTVNEANLRKYKGYLLGFLHRFQEAKQEITLALELYKAKNNSFGVAVSQFDFSRVYGIEGKTDSAFYFANSALDFWAPRKDTFRIITLHLQLINLCCLTKDLVRAEKIQQQTETMVATKPLSWVILLDFYYLSEQVYKKRHNSKMASHYKALYEQECQSVEQKKHFKARSNYL